MGFANQSDRRLLPGRPPTSRPVGRRALGRQLFFSRGGGRPPARRIFFSDSQAVEVHHHPTSHSHPTSKFTHRQFSFAMPNSMHMRAVVYSRCLPSPARSAEADHPPTFFFRVDQVGHSPAEFFFPAPTRPTFFFGWGRSTTSRQFFLSGGQVGCPTGRAREGSPMALPTKLTTGCCPSAGSPTRSGVGSPTFFSGRGGRSTTEEKKLAVGWPTWPPTRTREVHHLTSPIAKFTHTGRLPIPIAKSDTCVFVYSAHLLRTGRLTRRARSTTRPPDFFFPATSRPSTFFSGGERPATRRPVALEEAAPRALPTKVTGLLPAHLPVRRLGRASGRQLFFSGGGEVDHPAAEFFFREEGRPTGGRRHPPRPLVHSPIAKFRHRLSPIPTPNLMHTCAVVYSPCFPSTHRRSTRPVGWLAGWLQLFFSGRVGRSPRPPIFFFRSDQRRARGGRQVCPTGRCQPK